MFDYFPIDTLASPFKDFIARNLKLWDACGLLSVCRLAGKCARTDYRLANLDGLPPTPEQEIEEKFWRRDPPESEDQAFCLVSDYTAMHHYQCGCRHSWSPDGAVDCPTAHRIAFDYKELDREKLISQMSGPATILAVYGPLETARRRGKPFYEMSLNLIVAHALAHQLAEFLSPEWMDSIGKAYEHRRSRCEHVDEDNNDSERLEEAGLLDNRHFVSGYARTSKSEFWAECAAAFSVAESREMLRLVDEEMYYAIHELVLHPENALAGLWRDAVIGARAERGIDSGTIEASLSDDKARAYRPATVSPTMVIKPADKNATTREKAFEFIVSQAMAGLNWQQMCTGPMQCNDILPEQVEEEVRWRKSQGQS